ncbi:non-hydrolyzing UDP-N-acetylglucosamine 2-epimerase [Emticicia sp. C21]|uniref:non-hydrolyzing UDP-N-acetylglucosamine 2-epimerase n=1 Tax=Emticicia sp. C21 TaxID=2302915 RepID=UPI000E346E44|nr:UDP-N-acetylglucosamine 2-epimerase (non-hydrolyzing) [Emticicia sp. C21]RFS17233.1 UDP-N-acetylglucosamine 2-epimerase (non-hydrolyzing) [Emticicia sp. C21]
MIKLDIIAGARPNFIKIAPIIAAIQKNAVQKIQYRLIHTGQHYDKKMSGSFFEELRIPEPDINLGAGGGTQAEQTAAIMIGYERLLLDRPSDICLVVGDVTSTMACAIVAKKMHMRVVHVEGGIRSFDLTMPEEINRMVTDSISDYFYTTSEVANQNLKSYGIPDDRIQFVGNTMIDTLLENISKFVKPDIYQKKNLTPQNYLVLTLHRPANVDQETHLKILLEEIISNSENLPIIFPVHPRTAKSLKAVNLANQNIYTCEPLSYLEFNYLVKNAKAVITDSGGITEETTIMNIPCLTLRNTTERPETVSFGTNELIGTNPGNIGPALKKLFSGTWKRGSVPPLWDGKSAERIVDHLYSLYK